jgi:Dihydrofolate reductase
MKNERKVILYIAQSLDGFIAREDNDISWLSVIQQKDEDYGYGEFVKSIDTVIMGRKTYEKVLSFGIEYPHKDKKSYILSKTVKGSKDNLEFYNDSIEFLIEKLKNVKGKDIFIDGGAEIVKEFRSKNLIDQYIISIVPIMIGKGIRLFKETDAENKLKLLDYKVFSSGLVQLKYETALEIPE